MVIKEDIATFYNRSPSPSPQKGLWNKNIINIKYSKYRNPVVLTSFTNLTQDCYMN